jgi:hypothetical protein
MQFLTKTYAAIYANATCLAAFSDRIHYIELPLNADYPCIVLDLVGFETIENETKTSDMAAFDVAEVQMDIYADTVALCETYAGYVRTALYRDQSQTGYEFTDITGYSFTVAKDEPETAKVKDGWGYIATLTVKVIYRG